MNISSKHHYVPKFYLKGFSHDKTGRVQVFNKSLGVIEKDKYYPSMMLFEKNRNSVEFKGSEEVEIDRIENIYSKIDNGFAGLFELVRDGVSSEELLTESGVWLIKVFIAIQFWRLPSVDDYASKVLDDIDLTSYGDVLVFGQSVIGDLDEIQKSLESNEWFRQVFRCFYLPFLTFDLNSVGLPSDGWCLYKVEPENKEWANFLTSDFPFVVEDVEALMSFKTRIVFPLSKNMLLIFSPHGSGCVDLDPSLNISSKLAE